MRKWLSYFAAAALVAPLLPMAAFAQSTAVINACVSRLTGVSRIVSSAAACNANTETPVSWNQQGPTGAAGPAGPMGATGPAGLGFKRTIVVPDSGNTYTNGTNLIAAAKALYPIAADDQTFLILLDAGTYSFTQNLEIPQGVSVRGAGSSTTKLIFTVGSNVTFDGSQTIFDLAVQTVDTPDIVPPVAYTFGGVQLVNVYIDQLQHKSGFLSANNAHLAYVLDPKSGPYTTALFTSSLVAFLSPASSAHSTCFGSYTIAQAAPYPYIPLTNSCLPGTPN